MTLARAIQIIWTLTEMKSVMNLTIVQIQKLVILMT